MALIPRCVGDAPTKSPLGGGREFTSRGLATETGSHALQDLEKSPALAFVDFLWVGAFAFEIGVIDQRVDAIWNPGNRVEIINNSLAISGWLIVALRGVPLACDR